MTHIHSINHDIHHLKTGTEQKIMIFWLHLIRLSKQKLKQLTLRKKKIEIIVNNWTLLMGLNMLNRLNKRLMIKKQEYRLKIN